MSSIHADPPPPIVTEPSGISYGTGGALGKGGFAICHRAERHEGGKPTGHLVALKIVKTKMEPAKLAQKFVTELQIHSKLSHPNIVTFYRAFSFSTSTYVVLELCPNGSLADMLKRRKHLTLPEIRRVVIQICGAVKYLHFRHIVHRDLKTGNLFLDANMNVKVGDFGLAALLVSPKEMEVTRRTTMCGTPNYLAPEILQKDKGHNEKVDLWAIGVIAYTLAVGKAPFHASTKEEIYKKLRSGTYTWPELSATAHQSSDLRALVSSLLVPEEQRPTPDKIVSQNFFRIAYVPTSIPISAREKAPVWPEAVVPSPEVFQRGYSDTWFDLCKESGVGEPVEDQAFPLNGGRKIKSIVHDMSKEAQAGRQPTMPIPKDVVYISPVSNWDRPASVSPEPVEERPVRPRGLKEISNNEVASTRPSVVRASRDAELMPPPARVPVRAQRSDTVRKAARTISEEAERAGAAIPVQADAPKPVARTARTRPAATLNAAPSLKESSSSANVSEQPTRATTSLELDGDSKPQRSSTLKRSADASLARRPRPAKVKERPLSCDIPGSVATLDELKRASSMKRTSRKKGVDAEMIGIIEDRPEELQASAKAPSRVARAPSTTKRTEHVSDCIDGTAPDAVLRRITTFRNNLTAALAKPARGTTRKTALEDPTRLPFVSRWVDYSRKHGVGYVLSDGTVGCIINSSSKSQTPVTHVLVRHGQQWLKRVGKDFEHMDQVPLEFLEDQGEGGIAPKVYKGLGSVREGPLAAEDERRRNLSVLWVKFGRYMCQSLDGDDAGGSKDPSNFVRFYQRIGNVGVWVFADGCLQVHFPDHTKLVISASGTYISATCISTEAAAYLAAHGELLSHHVTTREVFEDSISSLLHEGGRVRTRIVHANALAEKLTFISSLVDQWIRNGGLGRIDDDFEDGGRGLYWNGLSVHDGSRKMDRVTVGRCGGDQGVKQIEV